MVFDWSITVPSLLRRSETTNINKYNKLNRLVFTLTQRISVSAYVDVHCINSVMVVNNLLLIVTMVC